MKTTLYIVRISARRWALATKTFSGKSLQLVGSYRGYNNVEKYKSYSEAHMVALDLVAKHPESYEVAV